MRDPESWSKEKGESFAKAILEAIGNLPPIPFDVPKFEINSELASILMQPLEAPLQKALIESMGRIDALMGDSNLANTLNNITPTTNIPENPYSNLSYYPIMDSYQLMTEQTERESVEDLRRLGEMLTFLDDSPNYTKTLLIAKDEDRLTYLILENENLFQEGFLHVFADEQSSIIGEIVSVDKESREIIVLALYRVLAY